MKGKVLIHFFNNLPIKPEKKWLFWLKNTLTRLNVDVVFSENAGISKRDIVELQNQFEVPQSRTFIAQHDPGTLSIIRFIEKVLHFKLESALLIAGEEQKHWSIPTRKELSAGKKGIETSAFSLEKLLKNFNPALVIVWIATPLTLENEPTQKLLAENSKTKKKIFSKKTKHGEIVWRG